VGIFGFYLFSDFWGVVIGVDELVEMFFEVECELEVFFGCFVHECLKRVVCFCLMFM